MHFTLRRPHPTPRGRGAAVLCCPRCAAPDVMYYPACTVTGRETQETACLPLTTPQLTPRPHTHHLCKVLLVSSHLVVLGSLSRGQFAASPLASLLPFFSSKVCVSSNRSGHCHPGAHHRSGLSTDMSDLRSQLQPGCSPPPTEAQTGPVHHTLNLPTRQSLWWQDPGSAWVTLFGGMLVVCLEDLKLQVSVDNCHLGAQTPIYCWRKCHLFPL